MRVETMFVVPSYKALFEMYYYSPLGGNISRGWNHETNKETS